MEDKIFDLLEKLYGEVQGMQTEIQEMKGNMATKGDISNMATKQDIARIENKMDAHHKVLYDGYKQNAENITDIKEKIDGLTYKIEDHEMRLNVLESTE